MDERVFHDWRRNLIGWNNGITRCASGGFACGKTGFGGGFPMDSLFLLRFNGQGDTLWTRFLATDTTLDVQRCVEMANGDLVLVGSRQQPLNAFLCRAAGDGSLIYLHNMAEAHPFLPKSVAEAANGDLFVSGYGHQPEPGTGVVIRTSALGELIWRRTKPRPCSWNHAISTMDEGVLVIGGRTTVPTSQWGVPLAVAIVAKYDAQGTELWSSDLIYGGSELNPCHFNDGFELEDGSFVLAGEIQNTTIPGLWENGMIFKLDPEGSVLWSRFYAHYVELPVGYDHLFSAVEPTSDGGFILTGEAQGPTPPNTSRLWLVKLDSMGCLVPGCHTVGVQEFESALQSALQVSPNPAREAVRFSLELPGGYQLHGKVQAVLLDAQGKEVGRQLAQTNGSLLSGAIALDGQAPGLYYLHLRDEVKWLAGGKVVVE